MTTVAVLDTVLFTTAIGWLALAALLLTDRLRHDRWVTRVALLRDQLVNARGADLDRLAAGVGPMEFDELVLEGVPPAVETALGRAQLSGGRSPAVHNVALGADHADVWTRIRAAQVLASARTADVHHPLDEMLRSGDQVLAGSALRLFVHLDDRRAAELLIRALADDVHPRSRIAAAFSALSVERAETLRPLFSSAEPGCKYWAARLACFNRTRQWAPAVRELTTDSDPFVRRAAVEALGAIGGPSDAGAVLNLFSDPIPIVRAHAARAAAGFSAARNAIALRQLLNDGTWLVRSAAAEVLGTPAISGSGDSTGA